MSLFDSASLVVTPNGVKEGKLYSIKPTDGSGDLSVTRATTATRVNSAGLVEVVPRNLVTYSQDFTNSAWTKSDVTISANSINSPNGTLTGSKIIPNSTNIFHAFYQAVPTGFYSFSIYAKAGGETTFSMWVNDFSKRAIFDLSSGTITSSNVTNSTIIDAGNGWYRCTVYDTNLTSYVAVYGRNGGSFVGNGVDGIYFWGGQVENFATATDYYPTTTRLNIPRLDYTNGSCPNILVEPQRTNLVTYSQNLDTNWTKSNSTVETNSIISPDGTQNATKLNVTTSSFSGLYQIGNSSVAKFTSSIFAKKGNKDWLYFIDANGTASAAWFNLSNGTLGTVSNGTAKIEDYGNGWYRCTYSDTNNVTNSYFQIGLSDANNSTLPSSSGYGYVWGAQREVGSYATSYIPTTSASVTRNADVISKTGISSLIGQTEGTIFLDFVAEQTPTLSQSHIWIGNGANEIGIYGGTQLIFYSSGGVSINGGNYTTGQRYKIAFAYKLNDYVVYINGVQKGTDTSATVPATSNLFINSYSDGSELQKKQINSAVLWKTRLSNTELAQLTTI